jgi:bidirectional [NiFe] hydrogenase diaphorase subunit
MNSEELQQIVDAVAQEREKYDYEVNVCMGTGCMSQHSDKLKDALTTEAADSGKRCHVRRTGCMGLCAAGPLVLVEPSETRYGHVHVEDAKEVIASLGEKPVERLETHLEHYFAGQQHIVLENSGKIDPEKIDEYIGREGYAALLKALTGMTPQSVVEQIAKSGLRGRRRWLSDRAERGTVAKALGKIKYVVCNGGEGDPGAFMDRSVLESDPSECLKGWRLRLMLWAPARAISTYVLIIHWPSPG